MCYLRNEHTGPLTSKTPSVGRSDLNGDFKASGKVTQKTNQPKRYKTVSIFYTVLTVPFSRPIFFFLNKAMKGKSLAS